MTDLPSKNPARARKRNKQREEKNRAARKAAAAEALPQLARTQPPLERYFARKQIRRHQFDAGTKLYEHWLGMGSHQSIVASYGLVVHGHDSDSPYQIRCYQKFRSALQALGQLLSPVLIAVCIHDQSAREWARLYGRSEEDGIGILRLALDGLAAHYGFSPDRGDETNSIAQAAAAVVTSSVMPVEVTADAD